MALDKFASDEAFRNFIRDTLDNGDYAVVHCFGYHKSGVEDDEPDTIDPMAMAYTDESLEESKRKMLII